MKADDDQVIVWYLDASFTMHLDMRSHTGTIVSLGKGIITGSVENECQNKLFSSLASFNYLSIAKVL